MLPWEYCFDKDMDFLALNRDLPLVRYIEQPFIPDNILAPRPARVLLASAGPSDMGAVDAAGEAKHIHHELQPLVDRGELEIQHLNPATLDDLQTELVRFRPHILHFIGHGTFDVDQGRGALILERKDGTSHPVSSRQLGRLLQGTEVKVIILNACKTASHNENNAFMGLAPALVRAEVPAVIAMQFAMPDDTAARFARQIYHFLALGLPLDRAITEARINLYTYDDENIFWAIPVLFMRAEDGVIWQERDQ
jgi:CHAT domain-containing protein